jgi:hypothetical protein
MNEPRTRPWHTDEFVRCAGLFLVYEADLNGVITRVHLPGGTSATVAELQAAGFEVTLPRRVRVGGGSFPRRPPRVRCGACAL